MIDQLTREKSKAHVMIMLADNTGCVNAQEYKDFRDKVALVYFENHLTPEIKRDPYTLARESYQYAEEMLIARGICEIK